MIVKPINIEGRKERVIMEIIFKWRERQKKKTKDQRFYIL